MDGFWSSPESWPIQHAQRQARFRYLKISGEPECKGRRGTKAAVDFQRQALDQLEQMHQGTLLGPVALDLLFTAGRKNPPTIQRIAKWALDVLGPVVPSFPTPPRRSVLYRDDRQVKLLSVRLNQAWRGNDEFPMQGSTWVVARPLRDAVADLELARAVHNREGIDELDLDEVRCDEAWESIYREGGRKVESDDELFEVDEGGSGSYINQWMRFFQRERVQRQLLASTEGALTDALHATPRLISGATVGNLDRLEEVRASHDEMERLTWRWLVTGPIAVPLPRLPDSSGGWTVFRDQVRRQLEQFQARWPVLDPLLVPLKITLLVSPSEQGKDLDNIALEVLPIAHDVFRPHISPWLLAPDSEADPEREQRRRAMRSLNARSVTSYHVIELRQLAGSDERGALRLALGCGDDPTSPWEKAHDFVDRCI